MGVIYSILEALIPFEFIDYAFMEKCTNCNYFSNTSICYLGTMIVNNKMAFSQMH